ncbi:MAG: N-formylglutamate amidohydrolase [Rhizobiaceae bacterium]|nr:N-formylglutamate amidohydrolase [Rhizobiaceae bacterium]
MRLPPETVAALAADAVEVVGAASPHPLLLLCEHAGNRVPGPWCNLGLPAALLESHFGYDPGVDGLTRDLAARLGAPAVLARYSRLFVDYNRFEQDWDHMRPDLGGIPVPANLAINPSEKALRRAIAVEPVDEAIRPIVTGRRAVVSVHSFTPVMGGHRRDVDIGVLWRKDSAFTRAMLAGLQAHPSGFRIGDNAPYDWRTAMAYSLQTYGLDLGLPCFYLEVNNALFSDSETSARVASTIGDALESVCASAFGAPAGTDEIAERR